MVMLYALTLWADLISVSVNEDSSEMEEYVNVCLSLNNGK